MKFAFSKVKVSLVAALFCCLLFSCAKKPNEEQIKALEETKAAALTAEKSLADKQRERSELEANCEAKKKELDQVKLEKETVLQKLEEKK
jgi:septal ring factor EnvC (AmiA/AmiB activator)